MSGNVPIPSLRARSVFYIARPGLWPAWPYLPVVRRTRGREELGVMVDFQGTTGRTGFGSAVFLANLFEVPLSERALLALPREVYDSADEVAEAGWAVD
jgi:hypothetical protein